MDEKKFVWRVKFIWNFRFEKVLAEKVTQCFVFVRGSRLAKQSDGVRFFDDFASAKDFALDKLDCMLIDARKNLEKVESDLKKIEALTDETVPVSTSLY